MIFLKVLAVSIVILAVGEYAFRYNTWTGGTRQLRKVAKELHVASIHNDRNKQELTAKISEYMVIMQMETEEVAKAVGITKDTLEDMLRDPQKHPMVRVLAYEMLIRGLMNKANRS